MFKSKTLVICSRCKGLGKINDYDHEYDYIWDKLCNECEGSGRMWEVIETTYHKLSKEELEITSKPKEAT